MSELARLKAEMKRLADPKQAVNLARFFKTGPGQYGAGDLFLGIKVPEQRRVAALHSGLSLIDIERLLNSKIHEHRLVALLIMVRRFKRLDQTERAAHFQFYIDHADRVNNWDLVDLSAPTLVGEYLVGQPRSILYDLAKSDSLWRRRIAIIATAAFIRRSEYKETLAIAEILMKDEHDLIHKAVGWMLREVGKRDRQTLRRFLDKYAGTMPRTMLRYSIEHFDPELRADYLGRRHLKA
jgi:3-methyladenine DNA glycosylase AlkD